MKPHIYLRAGFWRVRATVIGIVLSFTTFDGACRWAERIHR